MTAFKEVLAAEQEAEQAINTAKKEAVANVAAARTNRQLKIETEESKLREAEEASIVAHKAHIAKLVEQIQSEVQVKITALENRFSTHKADLKSTLTKSF